MTAAAPAAPAGGRTGRPRRTARTSAAARWNPTVRLATLLVAAATAMLVTDPVTPAVLWLLAVAGALTAARVAPRDLALAHAALAGFALSLFVANVLLRTSGEVLATLGPVEVTSGALAVATSLAVRALYLGTVSVVLVATTDPVRLMTSLHQHARLPAAATYAVLAGLRVLEQLPQEWRAIRRAQAVRDPRRRPGRLPRSGRALASAIFALLVGAVRRAERISVALESRGLGSGPRTVAHPVPLTAGDVVAGLTVLGVVAAVLAAGAAGGWLTGPRALLTG